MRERGERQLVPNSSSQTDAMADQPRQPACFLKTCNTDGSVFFQESLCFARIRFQRRRIKLPLFERDW